MRLLLIEHLGRMGRGPEFTSEVLAAGEVDGAAVRIEEERFNGLLRQHPRQWRGIGDVVAAIAKPIAKAVGLENCGSCEERREWLNDKVPFQ